MLFGSFLTGLAAVPKAYDGANDEDALATLNWLVEAGADEAIADEPVNRLVAKAPVAPMPWHTAPGHARAPVPPRAAPPPRLSPSDAIGGAMAAAASATTLAELQGGAGSL